MIRMGVRWRGSLLVALLACAGGAGFLAYQIGHDGGFQDPTPEVALENGGRLRVLKVSYGRSHEWVTGRFPKLDALRHRFRWSQRILGAPTERAGAATQVDGLYVFYCEEDAAGGVVSDGHWLRGVVDEHGCRWPDDWGRNSWTQAGGIVVGQGLEAYPRRGKRFGIEFGTPQQDDAAHRVRVEIPNPQPWRGEEWKPEPLPAVRESDGLRFVYLGMAGNGTWPWPKFRVEQDGAERPEWTAREIWYHDVTGNRAQAARLCRLEPAWKIEAKFGRTPETLTAADEVWDLGPQEIPGPGSMAEFEEERALQGARVRPLTFGGPGIFEFSSKGGWHCVGASNPPAGRAGNENGISSQGGGIGGSTATVRRNGPWLALLLAGLREDQRWNVVGVDESGKAAVNSGWSGVGGGFYVCDLDLPKEARQVRLKVVLQRLRTVEFTVAPPLPESGREGRQGP